MKCIYVSIYRLEVDNSGRCRVPFQLNEWKGLDVRDKVRRRNNLNLGYDRGLGPIDLWDGNPGALNITKLAAL